MSWVVKLKRSGMDVVVAELPTEAAADVEAERLNVEHRTVEFHVREAGR